MSMVSHHCISKMNSSTKSSATQVKDTLLNSPIWNLSDQGSGTALVESTETECVTLFHLHPRFDGINWVHAKN